MKREKTIIDFLDTQGLPIGIIPDADGSTWLVEVCGIPLMDVACSRAEAEQIGISEALRVLSMTLVEHD